MSTTAAPVQPAAVGGTLLDHALSYAARGWSIIPTRADKKPAMLAWKNCQRPEGRADADGLRRFFSNRGVVGLAVVLGPVSGGLACRDFDTPGAYENWVKAHPDLAAALPTVETGRGWHVYFTCSTLRTLKFDDGELRGHGAYVILPPSTHATGKVYRWAVPLPDGPVPTVDPVEGGLVRRATERTEKTEQAEHPEHTEADRANGATRGNKGGGAFSSELVELALSHTIPTAPGQRNRKLFDLARRLKAAPECAAASLPDLKPIVREWYRRAMPNMLTKDFLTTWGDFVVAWDRVKYAHGESPLDKVLETVDRDPLPECAAEYDDPRAKRLVAVCRALQRGAGEGAFFLSTRTAGELLGIDHTTASRWLVALCADRVLAVVERGTRGAGGRASRFRYLHPVT